MIFLTHEELEAIKNYQIPENKKYLERIRDVFIFCCYTGRKTFICKALSLSIPPNVVMKWTGHSDYKAMKPYIVIAYSIKQNSMALFDL